jgi:gas vesicle protein
MKEKLKKAVSWIVDQFYFILFVCSLIAAIIYWLLFRPIGTKKTIKELIEHCQKSHDSKQKARKEAGKQKEEIDKQEQKQEDQIREETIKQIKKIKQEQGDTQENIEKMTNEAQELDEFLRKRGS